jgi:hypothetical protein
MPQREALTLTRAERGIIESRESNRSDSRPIGVLREASKPLSSWRITPLVALIDDNRFRRDEAGRARTAKRGCLKLLGVLNFFYAGTSFRATGTKPRHGEALRPARCDFNPQILPKTQRFLESRVEIDKLARYVTDSMIFAY